MGKSKWYDKGFQAGFEAGMREARKADYKSCGLPILQAFKGDSEHLVDPEVLEKAQAVVESEFRKVLTDKTRIPVLKNDDPCDYSDEENGTPEHLAG